MQLFHVNFLFPFSSPQFTLTSCHNIVSLRENNKPKQMCWTHGHQQEQFPSKVSMWNHSNRGMSLPKHNLHLLLLFGGLEEEEEKMKGEKKTNKPKNTKPKTTTKHPYNKLPCLSSEFEFIQFPEVRRVTILDSPLQYHYNEFLFCWITDKTFLGVFFINSIILQKALMF